MFPVLNVGPLAIQAPGLILLLGIWVGTILAEREAARRQLSASKVNNLVLLGLLAGIVGARLGYALRFWEVYWEEPLGLLSLNPSTLAPTEGTLAGLLAVWIYGQRKGLTLWPTLDVLTPGLAAFGVALGISHMASGDAFGAPVSLPWAIKLWGEHRHPSQVYEILLTALVLFALWRLRRWEAFPGFLFLSWLGMTAGSRLFLEAFRGDSALVFGMLRSAQMVSLMVLLLALLGLHQLGRKDLVTREQGD